MTLIKSLLLGSAAGIVAIASAQAADLPTKKGAPAAQYVKICTITAGGQPITGFVLPGSDTCLKISGYVTGQLTAGNLSQAYGVPYTAGGVVSHTFNQAFAVGSGFPFAPGAGTSLRSDFGYSTRANVTMDAVSNTAMGPLLGHIELQVENSNGFDPTAAPGSGAYINRAYVNWAGITAGKANSFFSFVGGGPAWADFFSPDQQGFNQPDLLAYTAQFGGGFSATLAAQSAGSNGVSGPGTNMGALGSAVQNGMRAPDMVASLDVAQSWGSAHLAGVAHNVYMTSVDGLSGINKWGWALDAGVKFNLPSMGAGDNIMVTGAYSQNAMWYSGIPDGMWGEAIGAGGVNGNGQGMAIADAFYNGTPAQGWANPTAWSISADVEHHFNAQFSAALEGGYAQINWNSQAAFSPLSNSTSWILGGVAHYDPVPGLDFEFELLYQNMSTSQPSGYLAGNGVTTTSSWQGEASGFASRFEVTRSF